MDLKLNGKDQHFDTDQMTVAALVEHLGLSRQPVAVELNKQLIPKRDHDTTSLADGDTVEVVTLVGGG